MFLGNAPTARKFVQFHAVANIGAAGLFYFWNVPHTTRVTYTLHGWCIAHVRCTLHAVCSPGRHVHHP